MKSHLLVNWFVTEQSLESRISVTSQSLFSHKKSTFVTTWPFSLRNNLITVEILLKSFAKSYSAYKYFFFSDLNSQKICLLTLFHIMHISYSVFSYKVTFRFPTADTQCHHIFVMWLYYCSNLLNPTPSAYEVISLSQWKLLSSYECISV